MYSFQEVGKHNDRKDCWLIIAGKVILDLPCRSFPMQVSWPDRPAMFSSQVYDVTPFMEEHPGGDEVLLACTGNPSQRFQPPAPGDESREREVGS